MCLFIAGAPYKGGYEERQKGVVREVIEAQGKVVHFGDEIHTVVGAGAVVGAMDAANIPKSEQRIKDLMFLRKDTMIKEGVGATDIGEVVSRWTGKPVGKKLQAAGETA